jgi:hypothetical protein
LQDLRTDFNLATARMSPGERASEACYYGLAKQAIEILQQIDGSKLTGEEADLLIYLYLTTGQFSKLCEGGRLGVLAQELRGIPGLPYDRHQALLAATNGDYALAAQAIDRILEQPSRDLTVLALHLLQYRMAARLQTPSMAWIIFLRQDIDQQLGQMHGALLARSQEEQYRREWRTLRGLLALEEGDLDTARRQFRLAIQPASVFFESRPVAVRYLELIESKGAARKSR